MTPSILFALALTAAPDLQCASVAECNRLGTTALQEGRIDAARDMFSRQIDLADTALEDADESTDRTRLENALAIALNNAALAELRAGNCLMARAWLDVADGAHKATVANRRQLQSRCDAEPSGMEKTGQYRQYAGHGAWNRIDIRATGDETLRLDAFWMRISRGPLDQYGLAAFGELEQVYLHLDQEQGRGQYDGLDPEIPCHVDVRFVSGGLEIAHTAVDACSIGGAGAHLHGHYWRVGEASALPEPD